MGGGGEEGALIGGRRGEERCWFDVLEGGGAWVFILGRGGFCLG